MRKIFVVNDRPVFTQYIRIDHPLERSHSMKCQKCEKPATFHITDLSGDEVLALHLCPDCAKTYLQPDEPEGETAAPTTMGFLQQQLKL